VIDVASSFTQFTVYGLYSFCALCARAGILRAILDSISKKLKKGFCKNLFQTQASDGQRLWRLQVTSYKLANQSKPHNSQQFSLSTASSKQTPSCQDPNQTSTRHTP
jgi:hypothetical protein